jgi:hypothetical protein
MAISAGTASLGLQAYGALSGAISSYYSAKSQKAALQFRADMADLNARLGENNAQATLAAGQRQEQAVQLQTAQLKSHQRASLAASGVALDEGSAAQVLTSTDVMGQIDANTVNANAVRAAWGYRQQATNDSNEALMSRSQAGAIKPGVAAMSSLITGATGVASSWYSFNKAGGGGTATPTAEAQANESSDPIGTMTKIKGWY